MLEQQAPSLSKLKKQLNSNLQRNFLRLLYSQRCVVLLNEEAKMMNFFVLTQSWCFLTIWIDRTDLPLSTTFVGVIWCGFHCSQVIITLSLFNWKFSQMFLLLANIWYRSVYSCWAHKHIMILELNPDCELSSRAQCSYCLKSWQYMLLLPLNSYLTLITCCTLPVSWRGAVAQSVER